MGVTISKGVLTPLSIVSITIGFISFAFTVGTFFRVVWVNVETMTQAPHEVHSYLTNLRTELLEERANIKVMRRLCKKNNRAMRKGYEGGSLYGIELDDVSLKTMGDAVKSLMKKFKDLESPFLEPGEEGIEGGHQRRKRSRSTSPYYQHSAYAPPEKGRGRSRNYHDGKREYEDDDDNAFWAQRTQYANFNLRRRLAWLTKKPQAQQLFETLTRVQVRRTARQVAGMTILMHEYGASTLLQEDMLRRIDDRMGKIVGIRRVE